MKCRTKAVLYALGILVVFWLSAGIPEYMNWNIFPDFREQEPVVWFGFHWIMTSIVLIGLCLYEFIKIDVYCEDKKKD